LMLSSDSSGGSASPVMSSCSGMPTTPGKHSNPDMYFSQVSIEHQFGASSLRASYCRRSNLGLAPRRLPRPDSGLAVAEEMARSSTMTVSEGCSSLWGQVWNQN
jgi:hypothetical protein